MLARHAVAGAVGMNWQQASRLLPAHRTELIASRRRTHPDDQIVAFAGFDGFGPVKMLTTVQNAVRGRVLDN